MKYCRRTRQGDIEDDEHRSEDRLPDSIHYGLQAGAGDRLSVYSSTG